MSLCQLRFVGIALLALVLVGTGAGVACVDEAAPSATSPDGKTVAAGNGKTVTLLDAGSGRVLAKMAGHTDTVTALAFSPDGKYLASGSADKTVRLYDPASGKEVLQLKGKEAITALTFSKDGKTLTAEEGKKKRTWDVATGKEVP